jgi:ABC-2 type transport system ATP-binding protein
MTNDVITAESLFYKYGDLVAVDGISFSVGKQEILGFLGPNGAGKTTTFKMLTGQMKPKGGRATLLGRDIARDVNLVQAQIGVCFETTNLYEQMSARENLELFARLFNIRKFDADELLARVDLEGRGKDRVETYSKGMKQRLMVARAILNRPKILFLDEPTSGLDPTSADKIRNVILEERERGASIFLTTHDMMEADKLSDRVAFLNGGHIVALDTPLQLKQQYGKRTLKALVNEEDGTLAEREVMLDTPDTPQAVQELFSKENVVTVHSGEATLEDIFIKLTGRGLV